MSHDHDDKKSSSDVTKKNDDDDDDDEKKMKKKQDEKIKELVMKLRGLILKFKKEREEKTKYRDLFENAEKRINVLKQEFQDEKTRYHDEIKGSEVKYKNLGQKMKKSLISPPSLNFEEIPSSKLEEIIKGPPRF